MYVLCSRCRSLNRMTIILWQASVYNIDILWPNSWMDRRWRAGWPRPRQQCLKWGLTDSASPHGTRHCSGGGELLLLANWCNPATRSHSKSQIKKWSTSNKRKAKGADLQIVTSCHCDLSSWFWTLLYDKVQVVMQEINLCSVAGDKLDRRQLHSNPVIGSRMHYNTPHCK